ncbi:MAG: alpha-L-fucosidase, partial [Lachnospiraceae bacterium]|nr:alpha-L-fucosidase [Lachnospiraceae bacterium]
MKAITRRIIIMMMVVVMVVTSVAGIPAQTVQAYSVPANMKWWSQDKFGMFIHFGAYAYYGQGEWAMSEQKISKQKYQTE